MGTSNGGMAIHVEMEKQVLGKGNVCWPSLPMGHRGLIQTKLQSSVTSAPSLEPVLYLNSFLGS